MVRISAFRVVLAICLILLTSSYNISANTIKVPSQRATLQAAVDFANDGDTVLVANGTYSGPGNEGVIIHGKAVSLFSENGAAACTLLAIDTVRNLYVDSAASDSEIVLIRGITLTGGYTDSFSLDSPYRGGVEGRASLIQIRDCIITGCYAERGAGFWVKGGNFALSNVEVSNNYSKSWGAGGIAEVDWLVVAHSRFAENWVTEGHGGGLVVASTSSRILDTEFYRNRVPKGTETYPGYLSGGVGAAIYSHYGRLEINGCRFIQNSGAGSSVLYSWWTEFTLVNSYIYNNLAYYSPAVFHINLGTDSIPYGTIEKNCFVANYSGSGEVAEIIADYGSATSVSTQRIGETNLGLSATETVVRDNIFAFTSNNTLIITRGWNASNNCYWDVLKGPVTEYSTGNDLIELSGPGAIFENPLLCDITESSSTLDVSSPCAGTASDGGNIGGLVFGCNYYPTRMPRKIIVPGSDAYGPESDSAAINTALIECIPWDTVYFPDKYYSLLPAITVDKPLYLEGKRRDLTTLNGLSSIDQFITFESFGVMEDLYVDKPVGTSGHKAIGVIASSPIIRNCDISIYGYSISFYNYRFHLVNSSPLLSNLDFTYECCAGEEYPFLVEHGPDVMVAGNYWGDDRYWVFSGLDLWESQFLSRFHYLPYLESVPTDITHDYEPTLPETFVLRQNYPNPFNPSTTIEFELPVGQKVTLDVLNVLGQRVERLVDEFLPAGLHKIIWQPVQENNRTLASGVYLYRLTGEGIVQTKKMILLK